MKVGPYIGLYSEIITSYEQNPGKSLPVCCHFQILSGVTRSSNANSSNSSKK